MTIRCTMPRCFAPAAFLLVFGLAACDTNPSAVDEEALDPGELNELAATLATNLDLSADQARAIDGLLGGDAQRGPGYLWTVAADLQQRLTEQQKGRLFEMAPRRRSRFAGQGRRGRAWRGEQGGLAALLTPEQQEGLKALIDGHRAKMQALRQARQDGSLAADAFGEQAQALRDEMKAALDGLLTDEQRAALEQRRDERRARAAEFREATVQARTEALGLTAEQEVAWEALQEQHRAEMQALFAQVRAGEQDREAARAQMQALRAGHRAELETILTPSQVELVALHRALAGQVGRHGHHGPGAPGD